MRQVKDSLGALAERFKALQIDGGALHLSREVKGHALRLKNVVQYSPAWVKSQSRMTSTSNQETYRADVEGRLVFDLLRQVQPLNLNPYPSASCNVLMGPQARQAA